MRHLSKLYFCCELRFIEFPPVREVPENLNTLENTVGGFGHGDIPSTCFNDGGVAPMPDRWAFQVIHDNVISTPYPVRVVVENLNTVQNTVGGSGDGDIPSMRFNDGGVVPVPNPWSFHVIHDGNTVQNSLPRSAPEESNVDRATVVLDAFRDYEIPSLQEETSDDRVILDEHIFDDPHVDETSSPHSTQGEPNLERLDREFKKRFLENEFGHACDVCDRIWFTNDLKPITSADGNLLLATNGFDSVQGFSACQTCRNSMKRGSVPTLSKSNGFTYPNYPSNLPPLDPLTTRLISPRINFMQLRRLRRAAGLYNVIALFSQN